METTVEIDRTTAITLTHDFCDLFAFFDLTVCIQPYRKEPEYCYICKRKLSGYNYTGKCYHGHNEPLKPKLTIETKRGTNHFFGKPCKRDGTTLKHKDGRCVACHVLASKRQHEKRKARRAA